jgi:hypothetical protein
MFVSTVTRGVDSKVKAWCSKSVTKLMCDDDDQIKTLEILEGRAITIYRGTQTQ